MANVYWRELQTALSQRLALPAVKMAFILHKNRDHVFLIFLYKVISMMLMEYEAPSLIGSTNSQLQQFCQNQLHKFILGDLKSINQSYLIQLRKNWLIGA